MNCGTKHAYAIKSTTAGNKGSGNRPSIRASTEPQNGSQSCPLSPILPLLLHEPPILLTQFMLERLEHPHGLPRVLFDQLGVLGGARGDPAFEWVGAS